MTRAEFEREECTCTIWCANLACPMFKKVHQHTSKLCPLHPETPIVQSEWTG